ncbi:NEL-type E3 ubiquitin ligase domain-containing protein [uncultured Pseudomonas sp.]|uniref:NEL-type E3 ubiquitin ligase domain-containing protein n=1 Tax=uncultured Pseudomonas sp. TaxID=114707 RepID=UPI0025E4DC54|nr:NEL-type E3 ubiquitin ligase domain-containing protein [uncultured Pseudomonas sp.]
MQHDSIHDTISHATDPFIQQILPEWLAKASAQQLMDLRDAFAEHGKHRRAVTHQLSALEPLDRFARQRLTDALHHRLQLTVDLDKVWWREQRRRFTVKPDQLPSDEPYCVSEPALPRLMQNFSSGESFYEGTALIYPASAQAALAEVVLTQDSAGVVSVCRETDVGAAYQDHLSTVFNAQFMQDLANDLRASFVLATRIADARRQLPQDEKQLLLDLAAGRRPRHRNARFVQCAELQVLGAALTGVLAVEMRGFMGGLYAPPMLPPIIGVLLLMPDDALQPVRQFISWRAVNDFLLSLARQPETLQGLCTRVSVSARVDWLARLEKRLLDPEPDLEPTVAARQGALFDALARVRVSRIRDDARALAVPTAQADSAHRARLQQALISAGWSVAGLAGLFVPALGTLLLADLLRQTLSQLCEGVVHWTLGHRYEAVEHVLGVAETVAVNAALAAGATLVARKFVRSDFVDRLEPVTNSSGERRLWRNDLTPYQAPPAPAVSIELENGLHADGTRLWWRTRDVSYRVWAAGNDGPWRLLDGSDAQGFGPALEHNGERAWRLQFERAQHWSQATLLERLWPAAEGLSDEQQHQVLGVAGIDDVHLRGLMVEARPVPVQLRDTLERFAVQNRIDAFFAQLGQGDADPALWQFCVEQLGIQDLSQTAQADSLAEATYSLRPRLLEHFSQRYLRTDSALQLLQRDFPGLPDAYALAALDHVTVKDRVMLRSQQRLPLSVAQHAREMLQLARLTRMREGLYLRDSHGQGAVEVVFALLNRYADWPASVTLELRQGTFAGPLLGRLAAFESSATTLVMVADQGRMRLYDSQGGVSSLVVAQPFGLFEALYACLPQADRTRLALPVTAGAQALRQRLRSWLPTSRVALLALMNMRDAGEPVSPLRRLPDGRVGYLLSGRLAGSGVSRDLLRRRIGALYSEFDERQVESHLNAMMAHPETAYGAMLAQEEQYSQLKQRLSLWVDRARTLLNAQARRQVASQLRRAWRLNGDVILDVNGRSYGVRLNLSGLPLRSLPDLGADIDFSHVGELVLTDLGLESLPPDFLNCFSQLRWLNVSNNALRQIPEALARLRKLRNLRMEANQIILNNAGVSTLRTLTNLRTLNLSFNPLGAVSLQLRPLVRLRQLNLRSANLPAVPVDLDWCGLLENADLRDNHIHSLPQSILESSQSFIQALRLEGNPLPAAIRRRVGIVEPLPAQAGEQALLVDGARDLWLESLEEPQRTVRWEQWQALRQEPQSEEFFRLLAEMTVTSDFRRIPADLRQRVWTLVESASENTTLRNELFSLVADERTCVDSIASCFSALEVRLFIAQEVGSVRDPVMARAALLRLARRLFRLEQVQKAALADITQRRTRGQMVDEVEVMLAYRVGLAAQLELPGQPRTMQFSALAEVSADQLRQVAAAVRAAEAGEELAQSISKQDFWIDNLESEHAAAFNAVRAPFWERLEKLHVTHSTRDAVYLSQVETVAHEQREAIAALRLRLTREALGEVDAGGGQASSSTDV